jgi:large subunit ribosomal protein L10
MYFSFQYIYLAEIIFLPGCTYKGQLVRKGEIMAKVELKQPIVDEIKSKIDGAVTVVAVDYRGITVADDTKLRKGLREAGCEYKVYKNTLIKRAFEGTDFAQLDDKLEGPTAIAISKDDATAPVRVINDIAKTTPAIEFKAAVVEGKLYDVDQIKDLANIPSREVLLGRLLGSIQSPITNFARVLKQIADKKAEGGDDAAAEAPAEAAPAEA